MTGVPSLAERRQFRARTPAEFKLLPAWHSSPVFTNY